MTSVADHEIADSLKTSAEAHFLKQFTIVVLALIMSRAKTTRDETAGPAPVLARRVDSARGIRIRTTSPSARFHHGEVSYGKSLRLVDVLINVYYRSLFSNIGFSIPSDWVQ